MIRPHAKSLKEVHGVCRWLVLPAGHRPGIIAINGTVYLFEVLRQNDRPYAFRLVRQDDGKDPETACS